VHRATYDSNTVETGWVVAQLSVMDYLLDWVVHFAAALDYLLDWVVPLAPLPVSHKLRATDVRSSTLKETMA
jgi:hypothetical protein